MSMPPTVVIRVQPESHEFLCRLAREDGATVTDTLERLIRDAAETRLIAALANDLSAPSERDTPDFLALAGSVAVPAARRGTPWDAVLRHTRADRAGRPR